MMDKINEYEAKEAQSGINEKEENANERDEEFHDTEYLPLEKISEKYKETQETEESEESEESEEYGKRKTKRSRKSKKDGRLTAGRVVFRIFLSLFTFVFLALFALYMTGLVIAKGPSATVRDMLVLSAKQASATKWLPSLFLDDETINEICENSDKVTVDVMSAEEYAALHSPDVSKDDKEKDEWEGSDDGIQLLTYNGSTFKAYVMLIKDPSRVFVGVSSDYFQSAVQGMNIYDIIAKYDAVAGINGGEFLDGGGMGTGAHPMGLTYSKGECVWNESLRRTFIGFDSSDRLVVSESMSYSEAESLGIRDAVSFQNGNVLIDSDNGNVSLHYAGSNTGTAQRCAIGQREDKTVIMVVTDGRSASSLGATHNDMIDIMVKFSAVRAAMLDGGSSAMMYRENYFNIYKDFKDVELDSYQERGLVNKYKAFVSPRLIPTYFLVSREG